MKQTKSEIEALALENAKKHGFPERVEISKQAYIAGYEQSLADQKPGDLKKLKQEYDCLIYNGKVPKSFNDIFEWFIPHLSPSEDKEDEKLRCIEKLLEIAKHYIKNHDYITIVEAEKLLKSK